jgi:hypothetical protein
MVTYALLGVVDLEHVVAALISDFPDSFDIAPVDNPACAGCSYLQGRTAHAGRGAPGPRLPVLANWRDKTAPAMGARVAELLHIGVDA